MNQNSYTVNKLTPDQIGSLIIYPVNYTHENTLPCDGYVLLIEDYQLLYSVIGKQFNAGTEQMNLGYLTIIFPDVFFNLVQVL